MNSNEHNRLAFDEILPRIGELAEFLSSHSDPSVVDAAGELLDWIDAFHLQGIGTLVEMVREWRGEIFLDSVATHPVTGLLLDAYGLGTQSDLTAAQRSVQAALAEVRPYLTSHEGDMEVVRIQDGVVRLKLHGSCDGCKDANVTLSQRVEVALRTHWNDFRRLDTEEFIAAPHPPPFAATPFGTPTSTPVILQIGRKPHKPSTPLTTL